jgi:hypothetical protein
MLRGNRRIKLSPMNSLIVGTKMPSKKVRESLSRCIEKLLPALAEMESVTSSGTVVMHFGGIDPCVCDGFELVFGAVQLVVSADGTVESMKEWRKRTQKGAK